MTVTVGFKKAIQPDASVGSRELGQDSPEKPGVALHVLQGLGEVLVAVLVVDLLEKLGHGMESMMIGQFQAVGPQEVQ